MRFVLFIAAAALGVFTLSSQTVEVGTGAPNEYIRALFNRAYSRGVFSRFAALPPVGAVRRYGTTGLIQEFSDSTRSSGRMALVKANALADEDNPYGDVYQVLSDVFTYYSSVGVTTAGYPIEDTQNCPTAACQYQTFDRKYTLFAYTAGANETQNITVRDPFYTRWQYFGGISKMGPATTAETTLTSSFASTATAQTFRDGMLFNITSGTLNGRLVSVRQPIYSLYVARGGPAGALGYPTGDEVTLASGKRRQVFEGGTVEYDEGSIPVVRTPVRSVVLRPSTTPVRLNLGDAVTFNAVVYGADDSELTDRPVNFITTNGRVISVQANGLTAAVRAVGGGTARLTVTSEGVTSLPVEVIVTSQCCAVGEGAPTAAIQQAFQDAVMRNRLQLRLPGPERVRRVGAGYMQEFQDAGGTQRYLLAMSERGAQAYVVTGNLLAYYEASGGSLLGYPIADAANSARQAFDGGTLAGNPLRVVTGAVLIRWAQTGFEAGAPGSPVGDADFVTTFTGETGAFQLFSGGVIAGTSRAAFFVPAVAGKHYVELGGAAGSLGFPTGDESALGSERRQEFEGGSIEYLVGDSQVRVIARERKPAVSATPAGVLPGSRVRLTLSGFAAGATIRVSVTGQTDFVVQAASGAYTWESIVPTTAQAGPVRVRAVDVANPTSIAEVTYTVRTVEQARVQLTKAAGDLQSGVPGSVLANPLRIMLRDDAGNPVAGMTVRFTASPGALVVPDSAVTDGTGTAEAQMRLPELDGVALVTCEAARQVVTFTARSAGAEIANFPRFSTSSPDDGGALLAAAASIVRFHQNRGELTQPNGPADGPALNAYLKRACFVDAKGVQLCDGFIVAPGGASVPNLWRIGGFVGGKLEVSVEPPDAQSIRSLVAGGSPVLVAFSMNGGGSHFVVATGISADGSVQVHDPVAASGRTRLSEYTNGSISGALRLLPHAPSPTSFVVTAFDSDIFIRSRAGECGALISWPVVAARFVARTCAGDMPEYQVEVQGADGSARASLTDLADGGSHVELAGGVTAAFRVTRPGALLPGALLIVEPQQTSLAEVATVNAATFTPDIAPGGLISIFGSGLARKGTDVKVEIGGQSLTVMAALPFQINAQVPFAVLPGSHVLRLTTAYGTVERGIEIRAVAPALFRYAADPNRGIVVNADGRVNGIATPARRGEVIVIYATGLGNVTQSGNLYPASSPVTVVITGQELRPTYAGLTPGFLGLYQVNVVIPATFPPGLRQWMALRQASVDSTGIEISIQ